jgi:hypothetical protein
MLIVPSLHNVFALAGESGNRTKEPIATIKVMNFFNVKASFFIGCIECSEGNV